MAECIFRKSVGTVHSVHFFLELDELFLVLPLLSTLHDSVSETVEYHRHSKSEIHINNVRESDFSIQRSVFLFLQHIQL